MLTQDQIEKLPERITERLRNINTDYLLEIGHVIYEINQIRPSDIHRLNRMYDFGADFEKIIDRLAVESEKNIAEIYEMFDIIAENGYDYVRPCYKIRGKKFIPYEDNKELQEYVRAMARNTVDEYVNLTQHTAFAVFSKNGKSIAPLYAENKNKLATSLSDTYREIIDYAITKVQLGMDTYNSSMTELIRAMHNSGIKTVDYATGYSRRLDTAVRQNILWGIKKCNQSVADILGEKIGANGYEISYHSHPRPSHAEMGGKQYAIGRARIIKGVCYPAFSDVEALLEDYGCLHFKFPIILGASQPAYTKEQLMEFKAADEEKFVYEGKAYTRYEASQLQRKIETAVRHLKDLANMAKAADNDVLRRSTQAKINRLLNKYYEISKISGLSTKMERMNVSGFRSVKASNGEKVQKYVEIKVLDKPSSSLWENLEKKIANELSKTAKQKLLKELLAQLSKAELLKIAKERGVENLSMEDTKDEIIDKILETAL